MLKISLEAARVNARLSQKEAAKILKISHCTLSNWEKGKTYPPADKISMLCELYNISYDAINFLPSNSL